MSAGFSSGLYESGDVPGVPAEGLLVVSSIPEGAGPASRLTRFEECASRALVPASRSALRRTDGGQRGRAGGNRRVRRSTKETREFVNRVGPGGWDLDRCDAGDSGCGSRAVERVAIVTGICPQFIGGVNPSEVLSQLHGPPGRPGAGGVGANRVKGCRLEFVRAAVPPTMYMPCAFDDTTAGAGSAPELPC